MTRCLSLFTLFLCPVVTLADEAGAQPKATDSKKKTLNVLFIGNSYTARHNLATVVKQFAETNDSQLSFNPTQVIYGGRTLKDHQRLGTLHFINRHRVTAAEVQATIDALELELSVGAKDKYANSGLKNMRGLLAEINNGKIDRTRWDWVVLQSYRDDLDGMESLYMNYAPKFADLAKQQGAQVLLYETTPTTQNQFAITEPVNAKDVMMKAKSIALLAEKTGARVAPMSYVAMRCQEDRPDLTLRFENDAHLNQTMAYLTACTIFSAMFDRSPEGLSVASVTDIRYWKDDRKTMKDRDGDPIKRVFTPDDRSFLQQTAWSALKDFQAKF